jgi:o-succinylbenzoate synthase
MKLRFEKKTFQFKVPSGTSRGVLTEKHAWILSAWRTDSPWIVGLGECSVIPGLSPDFTSFEEYEAKLDELCNDLTLDLHAWPSIRFGLECALLDLENGGKRIYFNNAFTEGEHNIPINGLIWMGTPEFMRDQIAQKLEEGFTTLKLKIGALDFAEELNLLREIRCQYPAEQITLRVDANGAFSSEEALDKLQQLSEFDLHSIEQPIAAGQLEAMRALCAHSPIPIALDEELIGIDALDAKGQLLDGIRPPFIILKPSLHGGIEGCREWIRLAEERHIKWWITSALESNIGLSAICQFMAEYDNPLPQGLGTGSLYVNNISSDLRVKQGQIFMHRSRKEFPTS